MERLIENAMYAARWLLAPIYFGLSLALLALVLKFFQEVFHVLPRVFELAEIQLILVLLSLVGGSAGAGLLLLTSDSVFQRIVPWLLLVATALFALAPQLRAWSGHQGTAPAAWKAALGMLAVAAYGGYFNGGLGILLLALLGLLGQTQLNAMNGMKNLVSALLTAIAVGIYAAGGIVQWRLALLMMVAATLGGYGGARVARRLPATVLRWGIVATGLVMAGLFFARQ